MISVIVSQSVFVKIKKLIQCYNKEISPLYNTVLTSDFLHKKSVRTIEKCHVKWEQIVIGKNKNDICRFYTKTKQKKTTKKTNKQKQN